MKVCLVVGARPNFMKAAPLIRAFKKYEIGYELIHTGQHYDKNMSENFFSDLHIDPPDLNLNAWNKDDNPSEAIGRTIIYFTRQMILRKPDLIIVLGDVNSTLACAIVANKLSIPLAHVEAGERCGDKSMPEEMNRILVDQLSNYLFAASEEAFENLCYGEPMCGYSELHLSGDTMIDQLIYSEEKISGCNSVCEYGILTLHRTENVDGLRKLTIILKYIDILDIPFPILFPVHPRTAKSLFHIEHGKVYKNIKLIDPQLYTDFMRMVKHAKFVITDSGGLQVETSYLNVPCITLRERTERHDTINRGSNVLIDPKNLTSDILQENIDKILKGNWKQSTFKSNPLHDGRAAERIVEVIGKI